MARIIRKGAEAAQVTGNQKNGVLVEMLDASETVKANAGGWAMLSRWNRLLREIHHYEDPVKRASAVSTSVFSTLQQATYVAVMGFGAYLAAQGEITTGALLACSIIVGRINGPLIAQLPGLIVQWGYARASLQALDTLLEYPIERSSANGAMRPDRLSGALSVSHIAYAYPDGTPALEIERLDIQPGERVALLGSVGAGKSTLLKVMAGLYSPQAGSVSYGGLDLGQVAVDVVRRHVGYLSQSARLVRGSLRESLSMGLGEISDEELIECARDSGLEALFSGQSRGLDIQINEGGVGLSGGQRAIVGINRLIHAKPTLWLLDEPTAALDIASEKAALDALFKRVGEDDVMVMATHKLALIERFSRVVILAGGKVVQSEPVSDFLAKVRGRSAGAPGMGQVTTNLAERKAKK